MDILHKYYCHKRVFTFAELQTKTRAPCYKGINETPHYFVLTSSKTSGYQDEINRDTIMYDGYGLKGDQVMKGDNVRLRDTKKPLFVFYKEDRNRWIYRGVYKVSGQPVTVDDNGRKVFKFPLDSAVREGDGVRGYI
ncbi:MAG: hypothetical protein EBS50_11560 [Sphingomonadaceae bacterium]|jgi:hypothetical protein|nr:hypothetical protein [Sphingomonadaceae bacterium]